MLTIRLSRKTKGNASPTLGEMHVDGVSDFSCYTLEDTWRDLVGTNGAAKIYGDTCIPAGTYEVILNVSPKFKKVLPRLCNVPWFSGILIHSGNDVSDTSGCILVGQKIKDGKIVPGTSAPAHKALMAILVKAANKKENIQIVITDDFGN